MASSGELLNGGVVNVRFDDPRGRTYTLGLKMQFQPDFDNSGGFPAVIGRIRDYSRTGAIQLMSSAVAGLGGCLS